MTAPKVGPSYWRFLQAISAAILVAAAWSARKAFMAGNDLEGWALLAEGGIGVVLVVACGRSARKARAR